jgi:hypothetical protein
MRDHDTVWPVQPIRRVLAPAALAAACLWALPASAEERDSDAEACRDKREGDVCQRTVVSKPDDGPAQERREPGVCQMGECCTLDYSKGSPPESVCAPCLTCQPGPGDPTAEGGGAEGGADHRSPSEPPRAGNGDDPPASAPKGRGCHIGTGAPSAPAWALVLFAFALRVRSR